MIIRLIAAVLLPLLAACASTVPQYRYFTLDMAPQADITAPVTLNRVRIDVNEALSRPEILVRTSPTTIEYYALDRWASGLGEQIAEKLKTEFAASTDSRYGVEIFGKLLAFEQVDTASGADARVKLDAVIGVRKSDEEYIEVIRVYSESLPAASASPGAVVEALSRAVESIAQEMAADIQAAASN